MIKFPKTRVKKRKAKKVNARMTPAGAYTGRMSSLGPFRTMEDLQNSKAVFAIDLETQPSPFCLPLTQKAPEKMTKKELLAELTRVTDARVKDQNNHRLKILEMERKHDREMIDLRLKFTQIDRDHHFQHTRDLLEIMRFGAQEAKFPRS